jgi:N-methylhydantoinase B
MTSLDFDPVTLEILNARIAAAAEEMALTLKRTARSLYVKEATDFGVALVSRDGRFFGVPRGYGSSLIDQSILPTLDALGEPLDDGDVVLTNHPYLSGGLVSHTPDLTLIRPYFSDRTLVCYGYNFIHSTDVGGRVPSSVSPTNTEMFQEGLLLPPVKLLRKGELNQDVLRIYMANVRTPDLNRHDLTAMLAALETGKQRIADLVGRHGLDVMLEAPDALMSYSARKAREVLRRIPDGSHTFWDYLDDDAVSPIPVRLHVRMTARDGAIHLDFTETDPQSPGACNLPTVGRRHAWLTVKILQFVTTHDATTPLNAGIFDSVTTSVTRGSVIDPEFPAATGVRHASAYRLNDAIAGAFAQALPRDVQTPSGGAMVPVVLAEHSIRSGQRNVLVLNSIIVGSGARWGSDGYDGVDGSISTIRNTPAEKSELEAAVEIVTYGLNKDSAGPGRWRGGLGLVFTFRVLQAGSQVLGRGLERFFFQPWGMAGGLPGKNMRVLRNIGTAAEESLGKIDVVDLAPGDTVSFLTPGGGGYGDPFLRDPLAVWADVRSGFVSIESARDDYGVAFAGNGVDVEGTLALRSARPVVSEDAPLSFSFGHRRTAWDATFSHDIMNDLNGLLMKLPAAQRQRERREAFQAALPGLFGGARWDADLLADRGSIQRSLHGSIERMRSRSRSRS